MTKLKILSIFMLLCGVGSSAPASEGFLETLRVFELALDYEVEEVANGILDELATSLTTQTLAEIDLQDLKRFELSLVKLNDRVAAESWFSSLAPLYSTQARVASDLLNMTRDAIENNARVTSGHATTLYQVFGDKGQVLPKDLNRKILDAYVKALDQSKVYGLYKTLRTMNNAMAKEALLENGDLFLSSILRAHAAMPTSWSAYVPLLKNSKHWFESSSYLLEFCEFADLLYQWDAKKAKAKIAAIDGSLIVLLGTIDTIDKLKVYGYWVSACDGRLTIAPPAIAWQKLSVSNHNTLRLSAVIWLSLVLDYGISSALPYVDNTPAYVGLSALWWLNFLARWSTSEQMCQDRVIMAIDRVYLTAPATAWFVICRTAIPMEDGVEADLAKFQHYASIMMEGYSLGAYVKWALVSFYGHKQRQKDARIKCLFENPRFALDEHSWQGKPAFLAHAHLPFPSYEARFDNPELGPRGFETPNAGVLPAERILSAIDWSANEETTRFWLTEISTSEAASPLLKMVVSRILQRESDLAQIRDAIVKALRRKVPRVMHYILVGLKSAILFGDEDAEKMYRELIRETSIYHGVAIECVRIAAFTHKAASMRRWLKAIDGEVSQQDRLAWLKAWLSGADGSSIDSELLSDIFPPEFLASLTMAQLNEFFSGEGKQQNLLSLARSTPQNLESLDEDQSFAVLRNLASIRAPDLTKKLLEKKLRVSPSAALAFAHTLDADSFREILSHVDVEDVWYECLQKIATQKGPHAVWKIIWILERTKQHEPERLASFPFYCAAQLVKPELFAKNSGQLADYFVHEGHGNLRLVDGSTPHDHVSVKVNHVSNVNHEP